MMLTSCTRSALFGGPLKGRLPLRYIYVDEAGTSANEPVTIVAGIIIHADTQYAPIEDALSEVLRLVPEIYQRRFVSHATSVWSDPKYRKHWDRDERREFLKALMAIPRTLKIPVSFAAHRRNAVDPGGRPLARWAEAQHAMAFGDCIGRADKYIRDEADPNEVATVVAEDVPKARERLRAAVQFQRDHADFLAQPRMYRATDEERELGFLVQQPSRGVERVRDVVHFVKKDESPLLQVVDAIAFGLRRYFAEQSHGEEFRLAIMGETPWNPEDWAGVASSATLLWKWRFAPAWVPVSQAGD